MDSTVAKGDLVVIKADPTTGKAVLVVQAGRAAVLITVRAMVLVTLAMGRAAPGVLVDKTKLTE